ncbi:MAG: hypothetical protein M1816_008188 [Peltula sp. TS41687]|nr:MAG: hypothetical protein M1816_008188 [Peltula sp. TS41687]
MVGVLLDEIGQSIPPDTPHAVSVSLPTWKANVGYEKGEEWVLSKMRTGYPRFYIHTSIRDFANLIVQAYGSEEEQALLFPSRSVACRCVGFLRTQDSSLQTDEVRIVELVSNPKPGTDIAATNPTPGLSAVIFPKSAFKVAKAFWQHTGEGISSRRADYCRRLFEEGVLGGIVEPSSLERPRKGPKRYHRESSNSKAGRQGYVESEEQIPTGHHTIQSHSEGRECSLHVEERYGRNLDMSLVSKAKLSIRKRIAGSLTADVELGQADELPVSAQPTRLLEGFSEANVYLYPTGMSSIFNIHRIFLSARGSMKSVCFGFPYIDTLKILQKWGPGCLFYGNGSSDDLVDLEIRLRRGERFLALFCEFPSNPLLKSPDLRRIRALADGYNFAVVIDETVGNFLNVNVLPYADVVVSSLTKIFSGDSNVMGGSAVLNPQSKLYMMLKEAFKVEYEDNYWAEDVIVMERNSRDFASRNNRINTNAEAICDVLKAHSRVKDVYYPKYSPSRNHYDQCRNPNGGYGGLLSVTFFSPIEAVTFFDRLETAKGPSLGTNFTLSCPYTLLAHYGELEWAASFGVEADLVRVSVGLEDPKDLVVLFERALAAVTAINNSNGTKTTDGPFQPSREQQES